MNETESTEQPIEQSRSSSSGGNYRFLLLIVAIFLVVYWYSSRTGTSTGPPVDVSTALAEAAAQDKPVLLKFEAGWCPPCRWMDQEVFARDEVRQALADWIVVGVDVDTNRKLVAEYQVSGPPTFVVLSPQGREIGRYDGAMQAEQFLAFLQAVRDRIKSAS